MRIIILSWYFPPINEVGGLRVGKLADHLYRQGHEVWIISAEYAHDDLSLSLSLPAERVIRTRWIDVDWLSSPRKWLGQRRSSRPDSPRVEKRGAMARFISENVMWLTRFPDQQMGWYPFACKAGADLMKARRFDLIYASSPPFTCLAAAARLGRRFGVPWIAEYRDVWNRNQYVRKPQWRHRIDGVIEKRVTRTASAIVAATEPWAEHYRRIYGKPTVAIRNGMDEASVARDTLSCSSDLPVSIIHTGFTYGGARDPRPLFEGIRRAALSPGELRVAFYGESANVILPIAAACGVAPFVRALAKVPYDEALALQCNSDILLLLQSPEDGAEIPAKTFEYFAAKRPILGLGCDAGIAAKLVNDRRAGMYDTNPDAIAAQLRAWVEEKRQTGKITAPPQHAADGLSRAEQFQHLEAFLVSLL